MELLRDQIRSPRIQPTTRSCYDETFSPVVRMESFRTLVALSTQHNLQLHHVDVTTAYLNGVLEEEVYMKQPEGYTKPEEEYLWTETVSTLLELSFACSPGEDEL